MTIDDQTKIDIVATRPGSSDVRLVISDHLPWTDVHEHCLQVQEKVNAYRAFVESGQMQRTSSLSIPAEPQVTIALVAQFAPPPQASQFLAEVEAFLAKENIRFVVESRETTWPSGA